MRQTFVATHRVHPAIGAILRPTQPAPAPPPARRRSLARCRRRHKVLAANPDADLFDVKIAFRDASAQSYLIAGERLSIVFGVQAMLAAVTAAGMTVHQNRAALAGKLLTTTSGGQRSGKQHHRHRDPMTTSAMKITAPAFDMRHIAHRQCPSP